MSYTKNECINGLTYTCVQPLDSRIVRFACSVVVPKYKDTYSDPLLALFASTALGGTTTRSKKDVDTYLKRYGITITATAHMGTVHFSVITRSENLKHATKLLSDIIFNPKRESAELKQKQSLFLEENREAHDDAKRIAHINFLNALYPNTSYAHTLTLHEERAAITDLNPTFLHQCERDILKGEWFVTFVGSDKDSELLAPLIRTLRKTATRIDRTITSIAKQKSSKIFATVPGKSNVEIRIGNTLSITTQSDDYIPLTFGLSVLGHVGGSSGRLMSTVREKEGLTYGIYATSVEFNTRSTMHWNIFTFFTAKDLERGISATLRELKKTVTHGITEQELSVFKEILCNTHILAHDSNEKRLKLYHHSALLGFREKEIESEYTKIRSLTASEVNAALKKHIDPKSYIISGAGPVTKEGTGIIG